MSAQVGISRTPMLVFAAPASTGDLQSSRGSDGAEGSGFAKLLAERSAPPRNGIPENDPVSEQHVGPGEDAVPSDRPSQGRSTNVEQKVAPLDRTEDISPASLTPVLLAKDFHVTVSDTNYAAVLPELTGVATDADESFDLRAAAEQKAAPLAIAFIATGLLEPGGDPTFGFDRPIFNHARTGLAGAKSAPHLYERSDVMLAPTHGAADPHIRTFDTVPAGPSGDLAFVTFQRAGGATAIASNGVVSAHAAEPAIDQSFGADIQDIASTDVAQTERLFREAANRAPSPHARRAELVASLLPVSVTLHAADDDARLTVRLAGGEGDPVEFEHMARKILTSEGFELGPVVLNGRQFASQRRNESCK